MVFAKKTGELPVAVGVSLFLEKFVGCIEDVKDMVAAGRGEVAQVVAGKCSLPLFSIFCLTKQKDLSNFVFYYFCDLVFAC